MEELSKKCSVFVRDKLPDGTTSTWTADSFSAFHQQRIAIALQRMNAKTIRLRASRDFYSQGTTTD